MHFFFLKPACISKLSPILQPTLHFYVLRRIVFQNSLVCNRVFNHVNITSKYVPQIANKTIKSRFHSLNILKHAVVLAFNDYE
jgi:hypothetical protein